MKHYYATEGKNSKGEPVFATCIAETMVQAIKLFRDADIDVTLVQKRNPSPPDWNVGVARYATGVSGSIREVKIPENLDWSELNE